MSDGSASGGAVTAAEIIRNFGFWQQRALTQPLTITHHGRARVMLISAEEYDRLTNRAPVDAAPVDMDLLIENLKEGFVAHDGGLRVVKMNRAAEAFFGVKPGEMMGISIPDASRSPRQSAIQSVLERVLRTGEIYEYESDSAIFPGRHISLRSFPYRGGVATVFLNLTEQERWREDSMELAATKFALGAMKRLGLARLDIAGRLIAADDVFAKLAGSTPAKLAETRLLELVQETDHAAAVRRSIR